MKFLDEDNTRKIIGCNKMDKDYKDKMEKEFNKKRRLTKKEINIIYNNGKSIFEGKEFNLEKAKERWEKAFEKEMTDEEFVMFNWGYTYAINDSLEGKTNEN